MLAHFAEIGVVADVIPDAVLVEVGVNHGLAGELFGNFKGFEDGAGVGLASPDVVDLPYPRCFYEGVHETNDIEAVDVVPNLFSL